MKKTLDIDDRLLAAAKELAAQQRTAVSHLVEEGLRLRLRGTQRATRPSKLCLPVFQGRDGLAAGLDGTSNRAMLDALCANDDA